MLTDFSCQYEQIKTFLELNPKISIISHHSPDGDAVGSAMGLYHFLTNQNFRCSVVLPSNIASFLEWIPEISEIVFHDKNPHLAEDLILNSELIFCVDFNEPSRVGKLKDVLVKSTAKKVMLDHHPMPDSFADVIISQISACSASEITFKTVKALNFPQSIDLNVAICFFTGIFTDTNCFSVNSSQPELYQIVAELLSYGVNKDEIYSNLFYNFSEDRLRLSGFILDRKMKVFPELKASYFSITQEEQNVYNYKTGDAEGFVNYPLAIKGNEVSMFFLEKKDHIKISLRSCKEFDVNMFARKYYNGGGHKNAAGGKIYHTDIKKAEKEYIENLKEFINI